MTLSVNLPPQDVFRELKELTIEGRMFALDAEVLFESFAGQPFVGAIYNGGFSLKRNSLHRTTYRLIGSFREEKGVTTVDYELVTDKVWFFTIRILAVLPFLASGIWTFGIVAALISVTVVHLYDQFLGNRLRRRFVREMEMLPYQSKSRFKK